MHPVTALEHLGGSASRQALTRLALPADVRRLLQSGDIVRDGRGRYSLPGIDAARRAANAVSGVVSHTSAALCWGWEVKTVPARPHVTLRRNRRLEPARRLPLVTHWADLGPDDIRDGVTSRERTLADCLATLPFDEALAIADSALRHESVTPSTLVAIAAARTGPGSARGRRVAGLADARSANPFESVLRAIAVEVRGLQLVPQVDISLPGFHARPDLVDTARRLVVEADSHTWHSSRSALLRDCRRYNSLVLLGWTVLRFTWEDVMFRPDLVRGDLERFVKHAQPSRKRTGRR